MVPFQMADVYTKRLKTETLLISALPTHSLWASCSTEIVVVGTWRSWFDSTLDVVNDAGTC